MSWKQFAAGILTVLLCACGPSDSRPDPDKLTDFHRALAAIAGRMDAATTSYEKASGPAVDRNDKSALNRLAGTLRGQLEPVRVAAEALEVPEFANEAVARHAKVARDALFLEVDAQVDGANALRAMTDPRRPDPNLILNVAAARQRASQAELARGNAIIDAWGALGVKPDRVDTVRGGTKP